MRLGLNAKLYINGGTWAAPQWTEIVNVKDLTLSLEKGEYDATTREADGWRMLMATLKNASIEFQMIWKDGGTDIATFRNAFFNDTTVEVLCVDRDKNDADADGVRFEADVFNFTRAEPLEEAINFNVVLKPTASTNPPEVYDIADSGT